MKKRIKWILIIIVIFGGIGAIIEKTEPKTNVDVKKQDTIKEVIPTVKENNLNIEVTSQIIKKVDKKYRYFFDIRNKDSKSFEGEVRISLYRSSPNTKLGYDSFSTNKPIEPNLGNSVYIDTNTGPTSQMGENGITDFKYEVVINNQIIKTGEGKISDKFENLD